MISTAYLIQIAAVSLGFLFGPAEVAHADGLRVLQRDVAQGGPAAVETSTLAPYFDAPEMRSALYDLDEGDGAPAIVVLSQFLDANPGHPYAPQAEFALGYAYFRQNRWDDAYRVLAQSAERLPIVADYANYWAGLSAEESGHFDQALRLADSIDEDSQFGPRAWFLKARALVGLDRLDEGIRELEAFIARHPDAWYRDQVDLALGRALERAERWQEAARVYARARIVYPDSSAENEASNGLARVLPHLGREARQAFRETDVEDALQRGEVLYEKHRSERVIELLDGFRDRAEPGSSPYCALNYLIGKSYTKLRQHRESIPYYIAIRDRCDGESKLKALYNLGRAYWNVDEEPEAIAAFRQLVEEFPNHSYADDALLYVARVYRSIGDEQQYKATLREQIERFPTGDMLKDAVWLLIVDDYANGRYDTVVRFIDSLGDETGENDIYSQGRTAYFRARSLEKLSRETEARVVYHDLIESQPLGYYALLAFQRLTRLDPDYAARLGDELAARPSSPGDTVQVPEALADAKGFSRGRVFIRLGLMSLAETEFDDLREKMGGRPEIDRALSTLLNRAGAYHLGYRGPAQRIAHTTSWPNAASLEDWLLAYPRPFEELVDENAASRGLDPWLVYAIMREESRFQADVESWANARGLMQLMYGTAQDMAARLSMPSIEARDLFRPAVNIALGTEFMQFLASRFEGHPFLIPAAYNAGAGSVSNWLSERGALELDLWVEEIPYKQTRHYVKRVTRTWWIYHWLYDETRVVPVSFALPH